MLKQRNTQSQKNLPKKITRPFSFYKRIEMKSIKPQFRIKSHKINIRIENNPWNRAINQNQISNILKRLNDTPATLYSAMEQKIKQDKLRQINNKNKFKLLQLTNKPQPTQQIKDNNPTFSQYRQKILSHQKIKYNNQTQQQQIQQAKQRSLLKKIRATKKKYIDQYRKMLLTMKRINPDTDLPRIKYIQQNDMSDKVNLMHTTTTLKMIK